MKVKICGITNLQDALFCQQQGAWAIGFNFFAASPRAISIKMAKEIIKQLDKSILKIGIFINGSLQTFLPLLESGLLDFVQVNHDYSLPSSVKQRLILAIQANNKNELPKSSVLNSFGALLLDAPKDQAGLYGGTGRLANWDLAHSIARDYRLILAGGLSSDNCRSACEAVQPFALDVASSVERTVREKDHNLIQGFITEAHKHEQ